MSVEVAAGAVESKISPYQSTWVALSRMPFRQTAYPERKGAHCLPCNSDSSPPTHRPLGIPTNCLPTTAPPHQDCIGCHLLRCSRIERHTGRNGARDLDPAIDIGVIAADPIARRVVVGVEEGEEVGSATITGPFNLYLPRSIGTVQHALPFVRSSVSPALGPPVSQILIRPKVPNTSPEYRQTA